MASHVEKPSLSLITDTRGDGREDLEAVAGSRDGSGFHGADQ